MSTQAAQDKVDAEYAAWQQSAAVADVSGTVIKSLSRMFGTVMCPLFDMRREDHKLDCGFLQPFTGALEWSEPKLTCMHGRKIEI